MSRVHVRIRRLAVDGAGLSPTEVADALQGELSRLLAGGTEGLESGRVGRVQAELPASAPATGDAFGRHAARAIHGGLRR